MPSLQAAYGAAVAEMTGLDAEYIWSQLPLAIGRQYLSLFYIKHQIPIRAVGSSGGGSLNKIIK